MLKTESQIIDGLEVSSTQLPAMRAFALMTRLGKIIAPVLGNAEGLSMQTDLKDLGPILTAVFTQIDVAGAGALVTEILAGTSVQLDGRIIALGQATSVDIVFSGRLPTMMSVIRFALEVNFRDFFSAAKTEKVAAAPAPAANG